MKPRVENKLKLSKVKAAKMIILKNKISKEETTIIDNLVISRLKDNPIRRMRITKVDSIITISNTRTKNIIITTITIITITTIIIIREDNIKTSKERENNNPTLTTIRRVSNTPMRIKLNIDKMFLILRTSKRRYSRKRVPIPDFSRTNSVLAVPLDLLNSRDSDSLTLLWLMENKPKNLRKRNNRTKPKFRNQLK